MPHFAEVGVVNVGSLHEAVEVGVPLCPVFRSFDLKEGNASVTVGPPERFFAEAAEVAVEAVELVGEWVLRVA